MVQQLTLACGGSWHFLTYGDLAMYKVLLFVWLLNVVLFVILFTLAKKKRLILHMLFNILFPFPLSHY